MIVRKTQMLIFVTFDNKYMFQIPDSIHVHYNGHWYPFSDISLWFSSYIYFANMETKSC